MTGMITIPGVYRLVGKGVYRELPNDIPQPVRGRNTAVVGEVVECATAARLLGKARWSVTIVTRERCGCGFGRECRRRVGTALKGIS